MSFLGNVVLLYAFLAVSFFSTAEKLEPAGSLAPVPDAIGSAVYSPTADPVPDICDDLRGDEAIQYNVVQGLEASLATKMAEKAALSAQYNEVLNWDENEHPEKAATLAQLSVSIALKDAEITNTCVALDAAQDELNEIQYLLQLHNCNA